MILMASQLLSSALIFSTAVFLILFGPGDKKVTCVEFTGTGPARAVGYSEIPLETPKEEWLEVLLYSAALLAFSLLMILSYMFYYQDVKPKDKRSSILPINFPLANDMVKIFVNFIFSMFLYLFFHTFVITYYHSVKDDRVNFFKVGDNFHVCSTALTFSSFGLLIFLNYVGFIILFTACFKKLTRIGNSMLQNNGI